MLHRCQSRELKQDADMNPTEQSVIDSVKTYLGPKLNDTTIRTWLD